MMRQGKSTALFVLVGIIAACAPVTNLRLPEESTRPLVLERPVQSFFYTVMQIRIILPSGTYAPVFQTDEGVYYKAPGPVLNVTADAPLEPAGVFVPNKQDRDQRWG